MKNEDIYDLIELANFGFTNVLEIGMKICGV